MIHLKDEGCKGAIFLLLEKAGILWWMRQFQICQKRLSGFETGKFIIRDDCWNNRWEGKTVIRISPAVTTARPAILVIRFPDAAELIR